MRVRTRTEVAGHALLLLMLSMAVATPARPQHSQPPINPSEPFPKPGERDEARERLAESQAKAQNTDRQKRLVADTDKLLALATQLKEQVDKSDKNTLSLDVIKKAEEIEKLAHSVKEKMKG